MEKGNRNKAYEALSKSADTLLAEDRYEVGQDVYGLIFVSPVTSPSFIFAFIVVGVKFSLFGFLILDLYNKATEVNALFSKKGTLIRATQFLLLPIAIALQEDLIYVYTRIANIKYSSEILEETPSATKSKFALSFLLRLMDGIASLTINFILILTTDEVLDLFLNFAALHFLQGIDDVAFQMAHEGFLGDRMEDRCRVVEETTMSRRIGDSFTNALDSILFMLTYACMIGVWTYVFIYEQEIGDEL
ncbi:unnamed protein product [Cylindrotheca closterium]|uniref:Uncharacterized protein n=1 Tax=Cylindrotheca closterium TaxID=2856 RepID=A0AAD2JMY4_9STRA|nr:unnamed protein product [Cylindrotheca closterium]